MKTRKKVKDYSAIIAKKHSIPEKQVRSVLIQFCKNIAGALKNGHDVTLDDYLTLFTHKEAKFKYYKSKKENQNKNNSRK